MALVRARNRLREARKERGDERANQEKEAAKEGARSFIAHADAELKACWQDAQDLAERAKAHLERAATFRAAADAARAPENPDHALEEAQLRLLAARAMGDPERSSATAAEAEAALSAAAHRLAQSSEEADAALCQAERLVVKTERYALKHEALALLGLRWSKKF